MLFKFKKLELFGLLIAAITLVGQSLTYHVSLVVYYHIQSINMIYIGNVFFPNIQEYNIILHL